MKRLFLLICLLFASTVFAEKKTYQMDMVYQYYLPSFFGAVSGRGSILSQFENIEVHKRLLMPLEGRLSLYSLGQFSLAFGFMSTAYIENNAFGSMNLSGGLGLYYNGKSPFKLAGWNLFLYPVYDFPVYSAGKKRIFDWKSAFDIGYALTFKTIPIYINLYGRTILFWKDKQMGTAFDMGISLGIYIK